MPGHLRAIRFTIVERATSICVVGTENDHRIRSRADVGDMAQLVEIALHGVKAFERRDRTGCGVD